MQWHQLKEWASELKKYFFGFFWKIWVSQKIQEKPIDEKKTNSSSKLYQNRKNWCLWKSFFSLTSGGIIFIFGIDIQKCMRRKEMLIFWSFRLGKQSLWLEGNHLFRTFLSQSAEKAKVIFCCWEIVSLFGKFHVAVLSGKCVEVENSRGKICNISKNLGIKLAK